MIKLTRGAIAIFYVAVFLPSSNTHAWMVHADRPAPDGEASGEARSVVHLDPSVRVARSTVMIETPKGKKCTGIVVQSCVLTDPYCAEEKD